MIQLQFQPMVSSGAMNRYLLSSSLTIACSSRLAGVATPRASPRRTIKAVQMIDLAALAAREILRGRCVLARRRLGNFADGHIDIARNCHAIRFRNGHAFIDKVAHDGGYALTLDEPAVRQLCNCR
jgi:hypothetical protein